MKFFHVNYNEWKKNRIILIIIIIKFVISAIINEINNIGSKNIVFLFKRCQKKNEGILYNAVCE